MTVTYTLEVSQARFWGFPKLLARWRGSIYRLMYREMCVFLAAYYLVAFCYRYVAPSNMQRLAMEISAYVQGVDERGRLIRRALVRYLNLLAVLTFQSTSTVIKKRFPTVDHLVDAGLLTPDERSDLEAISTPHGIWWIPAQWFAQLAMIARKEGRIFDDLHLKTLIDDLMVYRGQCGQIWSYDWISVPLVYTQVVTIAVYSFFGSCLFGRQYLLQNSEADNSLGVDYYLPIFTIFQFLFYVGWLKVAESMICPFGEDDDDFDMNWLVDRNVQVSYVIVDQMHRKSPKLSRDIFWDNLEPEMPYTQAAANYKREPFFGSTTAMKFVLIYCLFFYYMFSFYVLLCLIQFFFSIV
ncbi:unnamed protein product [Anisakis simplex]|uniref:Bestrophin homolog n=1 Tax=Anisakis simplex TaxID=6269 RepID=A0A0M3KBF6_ANISI|nr:unnamed protein product [Anisakis simplex]